MQTDSFKLMKTDLTFTNDEIMEYLKKNLIKDYNGGRMAMVLESEWTFVEHKNITYQN